MFLIGRSSEATEPNTEYIFSQRGHYKAVVSSQNRIKFFIAIQTFYGESKRIKYKSCAD